jgi:glucose/arabinose dehydrogenase/4-amino-4-deoxy-L-arabinose transferase-like glycosyltransferase
MPNALPPRPTALLLALVLALLALRLGSVPLLGPDEPRYARVAVEMQRASEWVTPTLQGEPWLEKPPLYYWLAGAAFSVLGETEAAARIPSLLALLLLTGATALFGARLYGSAAGLHAGFVAGTSLLPFAYGRAASMDMLLAATVTLAIGLSGLRLLGIAGRTAFAGAAAAAALATLAKGPLGLLLPGLVVGGYLLAAREWRHLREIVSLPVVVAFALVAGPWYVAILLEQGQRFVDVFLLNHNVQRFTSTIHNHPGPFWYYLPVLLLGLFPWSGLAVPGLLGSAPRESRTDRFVLLWLLLPLAFFSLAASKLPGYILPCVPPLAILMGQAADRLIREGVMPGRRRSARVVALVGLVFAALVAAAPAALFRMQEPLWRSAVPLGVWAVVVTFLFARRVGADPGGGLRVLRVGAAGLLVLLALAAPEVLARRESGRALFIPAMGREVMVWGAWRTAWMAGYFYNDGRVREVSGASELLAALEQGPRLVLTGPAERRRLEAMGGVAARVLAEGPRQNALLRVERRGAQQPSVAYGVGEGAAAKLSADLCAGCHGDHLAGGRASSLLDETWAFGGTDADLAASIRDGRPGTLMPPFKAALDEQQIRSLVVLIRELAVKLRVEGEKTPVAPFGAVRSSERHAFRLETVADGLDTPWGLEFLPDGRILVTERPGRLRILTPGQPPGEPIRGLPRVWVRQDGGLLDVALHPDYARNGWIYLAYSDPGGPETSMTAIVRGRVRDGRWVDQEFVYRPTPELYGSLNEHYGLRFLFDRAGHLFYSIGDRGRQDDAQSLANPSGKIHRVHDGGSVPKDNPFAGREDAVATIWSYGNRNPQGLAFHPVTGELWASEHGPRGGDELNRIEPGRNYGWPVITHGINYDGTPISDRTEQAGMEQPVAQWTPSLGVCGIAFYTGERFPGWRNDLFVAALVGQQLRRVVLDGTRAVHQEVLFKGLGRVRDVVNGPDGYLYVALNQPGRIVRLVPR